MTTATLEAIKYTRGHLSIVDQLLLPFETKFVGIKSVDDAWHAIREMKVRGAPAIAIVGCLSLAIELDSRLASSLDTKDALRTFVTERLEHLVTSRPTAVNIRQAADEFSALAGRLAQQDDVTLDEMKNRILLDLEDMLRADVAINRAIGDHGADHIMRAAATSGLKSVQILTHCNTGSLATAGYGTALGVIRSLHSRSVLEHAYCTETRPYNQGARLTAYELVYDQIPATLVCDDMVGWLLKMRRIAAVVVGADRVVANGDTANKIGTYQLAIVARHHGVPFYVAAPTTSIDLSKATGAEVTIEERRQEEVTHIGGVRIAAQGINCWNPAFDITPAELVTGGIITEHGVFAPSDLRAGIRR